MFNQKECTLLQDLKKKEELCIEKYTKCEHNASCDKLKQLMNKIAGEEREHLKTLCSIMNSNIPPVPQQVKPTPTMPTGCCYTNGSCEYQNDKFILEDLLSTEKYVSSMYDTCIFEFKDTSVRANLNHIQKEEQQHGEMLYSFMAQNGMYS